MRQRVATYLNDPKGDQASLRSALARCVGFRDSNEPECDACVTGGAREALEYAAQGKKVLLLEPFWCSDTELQQLRNTQTILPALPYRFSACVIEARQALESGKLGSPGLLRVNRWGPDYYLLPAWARQIELTGLLLGELPELAYATKNTSTLQLHFGLAGGGMALLVFSANLATNTYNSLSLIGSNGAFYFDDHRHTNLKLATQPGQPMTANVMEEEAVLSQANMMRDFFTWCSLGDSDAFVRHQDDWKRVVGAKDLAVQVSKALKQGDNQVHYVS